MFPIFTLLRIGIRASGALSERDGGDPMGTMKQERPFDDQMQPQAAVIELVSDANPMDLAPMVERLAGPAGLSVDAGAAMPLPSRYRLLGVYPKKGDAPRWAHFASALAMEEGVRTVHLFAVEADSHREMCWRFSGGNGTYLGAEHFSSTPEKYQRAVNGKKAPLDALAKELSVAGRESLLAPLVARGRI